jgi:hypothetical protein
MLVVVVKTAKKKLVLPQQVGDGCWTVRCVDGVVRRRRKMGLADCLEVRWSGRFVYRIPRRRGGRRW